MIEKKYCIVGLYTQTSQIDCFRLVQKFCDEYGLAILIFSTFIWYNLLFKRSTMPFISAVCQEIGNTLKVNVTTV